MRPMCSINSSVSSSPSSTPSNTILMIRGKKSIFFRDYSHFLQSSTACQYVGWIWGGLRLQSEEFDPDSIESMRQIRDREWEVSEDRVVALLESKPLSGHPWPTCCFPPFKPGARFLLLSKRCILQFVLIKVVDMLLLPRPSFILTPPHPVVVLVFLLS